MTIQASAGLLRPVKRCLYVMETKTVNISISRGPALNVPGRLVALLALCFALAAPLAAGASAADAGPAKKVAFLGVRMQNDNEGLDPTSDAERARQVKLQALFKTLLEGKGGFTLIEATPEIQKRIEAGRNIGDCNGCEVKFGGYSSTGDKEGDY